LLDECLPRRLKRAFESEHEVTTVPERGWAGKQNGELLTLATREFDVFITVDTGVEFQQNVGSSSLTVVLLRAASNRLEALLPLMPTVLRELAGAAPGRIVRIGDR
jgi:predicted nuclease of predicted toxin-antitoxin system